MVYSRKPPIGLLSNREPSLRKGFLDKALAKTGSAEPENLSDSARFSNQQSAVAPCPELLQFDFGASCFQLAFDLVCFGLVYAFFDSFAASIDQVFCVFEAQTSDGADFFDHSNF